MNRKVYEEIPHALILAGGFGTRLKSVVPDQPKALANVLGKPFIVYQLEWLIEQGITHVTLAVHHLAGQLQSFVREWSDKRLVIDYVYEDEPLGTGGAIANAVLKQKIKGKILVINGDTLFQFSLKKALLLMSNTTELALLFASEKKDIACFGSITVEDNYATSFHQATEIHKPGLVNGGAYLLDVALFKNMKIRPFSLEYEFFPSLINQRKLLVYVLSKKENFFDIGTPESYRQICSKDGLKNE